MVVVIINQIYKRQSEKFQSTFVLYLYPFMVSISALEFKALSVKDKDVRTIRGPDAL